MLFSGRSHPVLAQRIADQLNIELGDVKLKTFANGEIYCRYKESIRGADVFIVQACHGLATNDYLWELQIMIQAAKLASANRITAIMPWFPYSRQDKKSAPREPITAKLLADVLDAAGADRVLTMDLHAGQIQGFFRIPVDHMTALPLFARYYRETLGLHGDGVVAVSPDPGRAKMATKFAQMLDADFALMNKQRPAHDVASVTEVVGDVRRQGRDHERRHHRHRRDARRRRARRCSRRVRRRSTRARRTASSRTTRCRSSPTPSSRASP